MGWPRSQQKGDRGYPRNGIGWGRAIPPKDVTAGARGLFPGLILARKVAPVSGEQWIRKQIRKRPGPLLC
jgi:hypothetical protein